VCCIEPEELEEKVEYVPAELCPMCGSRLRIDRKARLVWCASLVCGFQAPIEE